MLCRPSWMRRPTTAMLSITALASVTLISPFIAQAQQSKPNIVVIMTDDVGWGDLGATAAGHARRTDAESRPSRRRGHALRQLLRPGELHRRPGLVHHRSHSDPYGAVTVLVPGDPDHITPETPTVAQFLKEKAGYTTVQLGKWHLGDVEEAYPTSVGFDEMYHMLPYYAGVYAYDDPSLNPAWPKNDTKFMAIWDTTTWTSGRKQGGPAAKNLGSSRTRIWHESTRKFSKPPSSGSRTTPRIEKPFFMYLNFMKVHQPNFPSPEWKGKSPAGMHPYLDSLMELDDNSGKVVQAVRDRGDRREHADHLDDRQRRLGRRLAGRRLHAVPWEKGSGYEGGFRCPRHRLLAGQDQAWHRGDRDDVAHGLVADVRRAARRWSRRRTSGRTTTASPSCSTASTTVTTCWARGRASGTTSSTTPISRSAASG